MANTNELLLIIRNRLAWSALIATFFIASLQRCSAANLAVVVANAPRGTSAIEVAVDGNGIVSPLLMAATPDESGVALINFKLPNVEGVRVRAIAIKGRATEIFPFILAVAGTKLTRGGTARITLDFATEPLLMKIDEITDGGDGTAIVSATFASGGQFFVQGQVVNLWASSSPPQRSGSGKLFLTALLPSTKTFGGTGTSSRMGQLDTTVLEARFKIPRTFVNGYLQIGYHALEFQHDLQIPLLVAPMYTQMGTGTPIDTPLAAGPDRGSEVLPSAQPQRATALQVSSPGEYTVKAGKDGRLVRVRK